MGNTLRGQLENAVAGAKTQSEAEGRQRLILFRIFGEMPPDDRFEGQKFKDPREHLERKKQAQAVKLEEEKQEAAKRQGIKREVGEGGE